MLIQELLLTVDTYAEAVERLTSDKVTSPGYVIVGGLQNNEGIVITRSAEQTDHINVLSDESWYVAQTNRDIWDFDDPRYNSTVSHLNALGQQEQH